MVTDLFARSVSTANVLTAGVWHLSYVRTQQMWKVFRWGKWGFGVVILDGVCGSKDNPTQQRI